MLNVSYKKIASLPKTPAQAIMLVTFAAAVASIINRGFGLTVGALLAKEVAKKVPRTDYRLLIASSYNGFLGIVYMVFCFMNGGTMDVNAVNMIMLFGGIILHGSPLSYMQAVVNGAKGTAGKWYNFHSMLEYKA